MFYGFYKLRIGVLEWKYVPKLLASPYSHGKPSDSICACSELGREKMWSRIHLIPLLQAEEDRDQVRRYYADKAREEELVGSENKTYHSDRYDPTSPRRVFGLPLTRATRFVRPTFTLTPPVDK